jgi:hypothetical protein
MLLSNPAAITSVAFRRSNTCIGDARACRNEHQGRRHSLPASLIGGQPVFVGHAAVAVIGNNAVAGFSTWSTVSLPFF